MISTGRVWFFTQLGIVLFASLWMTTNPTWHFTLFLSALLMNILRRISWKIWLGRILPFLFILLIFQLLITPFYRPLLNQLFTGKLLWTAWWPPLIGLLRLGTPFLVITAFSSQFTQPQLLEELVKFLNPLRLIGIRITPVQMVVPLSLRFFPILVEVSQQIKENLAIFQKSRVISTKLTSRILQWRQFYQMIFSHSLNAAIQAGDALALRGWQPSGGLHFNAEDGLVLFLSLSIGALLFFCQPGLFYVWLIIAIWIGFVLLDWKVNNAAHRTAD